MTALGRNLLEGHVVLITAAAGAGIGSATARRCAQEGADLMISDLHAERLEHTATTLAAETGRRVERCVCDVTSEDQVQALIARTLEAYGRVDGLVNNAGLGGESLLIEMSDEAWSRVLDVSLTSVFRMMRAVLPHMMEARRGVIVNNASVLGWRAQKRQAHYAAAKAGVMALTRCAAMEVAELEVRINAVAPSLATHPFLEKVVPPVLLKELESREAFGRAAHPWEVANVIVFLLSDYASYLTGEVIPVSCQRA